MISSLKLTQIKEAKCCTAAMRPLCFSMYSTAHKTIGNAMSMRFSAKLREADRSTMDAESLRFPATT